MSTLADSMLSWKANLTTRATPEQVLTLRADVNAFAYGVQFLEFENTRLKELLTFYLRCLTKGHVNCDSCAISGDGDCGHGRMVIDKARELGIEVDE